MSPRAKNNSVKGDQFMNRTQLQSLGSHPGGFQITHIHDSCPDGLGNRLLHGLWEVTARYGIENNAGLALEHPRADLLIQVADDSMFGFASMMVSHNVMRSPTLGRHDWAFIPTHHHLYLCNGVGVMWESGLSVIHAQNQLVIIERRLGDLALVTKAPFHVTPAHRVMPVPSMN